MKKIILILIIIFLSFNLFAKDEKMRLAILDLQPQKVDKPTAIIVSDLLRTELYKMGLFRILERGEMNIILKEQEFQLSGCTATKCAVEVGQLLSAKKILVGTIGKLGKKYIINARIVDVENGEMDFGEKSTADSEETLDDAVSEFARKLSEKITGKKIKPITSKSTLKKKLNLTPNKLKTQGISSEMWDKYKYKIIDMYFHLKKNIPNNSKGNIQKKSGLNSDIIIVGIDETAINKFGQFPWKRSVYAEFLNSLKASKPAIISFDIFFVNYSNPIDDSSFFSALKNNKNKNIFFSFPFQKKNKAINLNRIEKRLNLLNKNSFNMPGNTKSLLNYNFVTIPLPEIISNSQGAGHTIMKSDSNGIYRKLPLVVKFNNKLYPHITLLLALNYWQVPLKNVEINFGKHILLKNVKSKTKNIKIPIDDNGMALINYAGYPGEFITQSQYLSFADVFKTPPEFFNGKILLIGSYSQNISYDIFPSPLGIMYGIEHNAHALNTILQEDFLTLEKINKFFKSR